MSKQHGFSFLELAIFLLILTVLLGGVLTPMATQVQMRKIKETEQLLKDAKEALYGYAMTHGELPCPDNDRDGEEDSPCPDPNYVGFLPWNALGVPPTDAWGRLFHYGVTVEFTNSDLDPTSVECIDSDGNGFPDPDGDLDLCDIGNMQVFSPREPNSNSPHLAPAIIISVGPNGLGGTDLHGNSLPSPSISAPVNARDEARNALVDLGARNQFTSRPYFTSAPATCDDSTVDVCNFDDLVVWISAPVLFNRMVMAGQLP